MIQLSYSLRLPVLQNVEENVFWKAPIQNLKDHGQNQHSRKSEGEKSNKKTSKAKHTTCLLPTFNRVFKKDRLTSSADSSDRGPMSCKELTVGAISCLNCKNYLCGKHSCGSPLGLFLPLHCSQSCGWGTRRFAVTWRDFSGYFWVSKPWRNQ